MYIEKLYGKCDATFEILDTINIYKMGCVLIGIWSEWDLLVFAWFETIRKNGREMTRYPLFG